MGARRAWHGPIGSSRSNMAREEYAHAHVLFESLLEKRPTDYSALRTQSLHKVAVGQRMRPVPLQLNKEDSRAAEAGIGV